MAKIYAFGESVLDIIFEKNQPKTAKPGGAMLNTSVTLGRLKLPVHLISEFGKDIAGNIIENFLNSNGVFTQYVDRYSKGKSSLALAFLDDNKNATYDFYKIWPEKHLQINLPDIATDDILIFGSYYARTEEIRPFLTKILTAAQEKNAIVIYDPNVRKSDVDKMEEIRPSLIENMCSSTIVRGSHEDYYYIFGTRTPEDTYSIVRNFCPVMIYTSSTEGSDVFTNKYSVHVPSIKITPVSTIGAGDNFNAGVIFSLIRERVSKSNLNEISPDKWMDILNTAVEFATQVCLSFDNYISKEFAMNYTE